MAHNLPPAVLGEVEFDEILVAVHYVLCSSRIRRYCFTG